MSIGSQQSHTSHAGPSRQLALAVALLIFAGLSGCTAVQPPTAAPETEDAAVMSMPHEGALDPGTYLVDTFDVPFNVTVPEGWDILGGWRLIKSVGDEQGVFLTFLNAGYVPADACGWPGTLAQIEPSIEGFADALAVQKSTTTTVPTQISVGDYRALEFDLAVEGDVDIDDCSSAHVCIHSEASSCTRWYTSVTERETYRVVDLDGSRAILSVGQYDDEVDAAVMDEAWAVFDSIEFVTNE